MAGTTYDGISSTQYFSSQVSGTNIQGTSGTFTQLDGTNLGGTNITVTGSITDAVGRLRSAGTGSPSSFGAFVQVATGSTNAGNSGLILFGNSFSNTNYVAVITPTRSYVGTGDHAGSPYYISGLKNTSGLVIIGPTGTTFSCVAVGL